MASKTAYRKALWDGVLGVFAAVAAVAPGCGISDSNLFGPGPSSTGAGDATGASSSSATGGGTAVTGTGGAGSTGTGTGGAGTGGAPACKNNGDPCAAAA